MSHESQGRSEQSSSLQLEAFRSLAERRFDPARVNLLGKFVLYSPSNAYGYDGFWDYAENATKRNLQDLYTYIYPDTDERSTFFIAAADRKAIAKLDLLGQWSDYDPDDPDIPEFRSLTFGTDSYNYDKVRLFPRSAYVSQYPAYQDRIEQGMPRPLQLFLAARAMIKLESREDWRQHSANKLYNVPAIFNLSQDEIMTVTKVADATFPGTALLSIVVADERLRERYSRPDGTGVDVTVLGGEERLRRTAGAAFIAFAESSGKGQSSRLWLDLEQSIEPKELSRALSVPERQILVRHTLYNKPAIPALDIAIYVPAREAAGLARDFIVNQLDEDESRTTHWSLRKTAQHLGCPGPVVAAVVFHDFKNEFHVITTAKDPDDRELEAFVTTYQQAAENTDADLLQLLKVYQSVMNGGDLYWPTDGWDGSDESTRLSQELGTKRSAALQKLDKLRAQITEKLAAASQR